MIAQMFAVIGRDDHQGVVEHAPPAELIDKHPELMVHIENTVVVDIDGHLDVGRGHFRLVERVPAFQSRAIEIRDGRSPKAGIERSGTSYGEWASL